MRLINAKTMTLEEDDVDDYNAPPYAILSHTWGPQKEEISFGDLERWSKASPPPESSPKSVGWAKMENTCRTALEHGLEYVWIDTCCIDKSSSAVLQEAINSMYRWYKRSSVCFAYLQDVDKESEAGMPLENARWFRRGWTLQELLAPRNLVFFDRAWRTIGRKHFLSHRLSEITGISSVYLRSEGRAPQSASVAARMSWAAKRKTTRREDVAYSLMGLFDVFMPLLYGEGDNAFIRLQEEIIKKTDDSSILSWGYKPADSGSIRSLDRDETSMVFAAHPRLFEHCAELETELPPSGVWPSFSVTQRGLAIMLDTIHDEVNSLLTYGILGCGRPVWAKWPDRVCSFIAIPVVSAYELDGPGVAQVRGSGHAKDEYFRAPWSSPILVSTDWAKKARAGERIVIRRLAGKFPMFSELPFSIGSPGIESVTATYPPQPLDGKFRSLCTHPSSGARGPDLSGVVHEPVEFYNNHVDQTMVAARIGNGTNWSQSLLIVVKHTAVERPLRVADSWRPLDTFQIDFRVFATPRESLGFEELYELAVSQDFGRFKELEIITQDEERHLFRVGTSVLELTHRRTRKFGRGVQSAARDHTEIEFRGLEA